MNFHDTGVGQRVLTSHGAGTVDNVETCADNRSPTGRITTGRYGVKLDNSPFAGIKNGVAYYWPTELSKATP